MSNTAHNRKIDFGLGTPWAALLKGTHGFPFNGLEPGKGGVRVCVQATRGKGGVSAVGKLEKAYFKMVRPFAFNGLEPGRGCTHVRTNRTGINLAHRNRSR